MLELQAVPEGGDAVLGCSGTGAMNSGRGTREPGRLSVNDPVIRAGIRPSAARPVGGRARIRSSSTAVVLRKRTGKTSS